MRIVKSSSTSLLEHENKRLQEQIGQCRRQEKKISRLSLQGMDGKAADKLRRQISLQSTVVKSHRQVYESLIRINKQNVEAIWGLPETSKGVVDTGVAQQRIDSANAEIKRLRAECKSKLATARTTNAQIATANTQLPTGLTTPPTPLINLSAIDSYYARLIGAQQSIVDTNKKIKRKAEEYDRLSASLYKRVDLSTFRASTKSVSSYVATGKWGNTKWRDETKRGLFWGGVWSFLKGDFEGEGTWFFGPKNWEWGKEGRSTFLGAKTSGAIKGKVCAWEGSIKPYGAYRDANEYDVRDTKEYKESTGAGIGVAAKGRFSLLQGEAEGDWGYLHGDAKARVLTGAAEGTMGASLWKNGKFDPSIEAKVGVSGSVVQVESNARLGGDALDAHGHAGFDVLTGSADAGIGISKEGVKAKAGYEGYLIKGKVSGGINIMGIKIDIGIEGGAGGGGAKLGSEVGPKGVKGEVGVGLGLGAGVSFSVDWSGFPKAVDSTINGVKNFFGKRK